MENLVLFKGHIGGVTIILNKDAPFEEVLRQFIDKLEHSKKFFEGPSINLHFKGRLLEEYEEEILLQALAEQNIVNIAYIQLMSKTEQGVEKVTLQSTLSIDEKQNHLGKDCSITQFYRGTVRSGQHIEYKGSVVIIGDVNPGAIVSADGNVVVLGALKGTVWAGQAPYVENPFIIAYQMKPLQIKICESMANTPEEDYAKEVKNIAPQIAYLSKDQIYVEEMDYKTLQHMLE